MPSRTPSLSATKPLRRSSRLGDYAASRNSGVRLAIEPREQPAPNNVGEVRDFLTHVPSPEVSVCIDSAHVALGRQGMRSFHHEVATLGDRIHSVHISAPDRGQIVSSWIPWNDTLSAVLPFCGRPLQAS